jgi:MFS family permease
MKNVGYKVIFKQKEFMKTVIADIVNRFGDSIDTIAFVWLVYQVTQSAAWSAIIFGVNKIPTVLLQPFAGAVIERMKKKRIMVFTDIIRGLCVGFIATAYIAGFLNQWYMLAASLIISSAEAFRGPASSALIPKLLEQKHYEFGLSLSRSASSIMELVGLSVAGIIVAKLSITAAIYIDMATFFISAFILSLLRIKEDAVIKTKIKPVEYVTTLKEGFAYLNQQTLLKYFVILALFLNAILVPFNSLSAPLISEVLRSDELMMSVLYTAISVGMIIGAALYPYLSGRLSKRAIVIISGYSIGLYYFTFILTGSFISSAILKYIIIGTVSFIIGAAIALLSSMCSVEFMKNVREEYLARSSALFNAVCTAATPVASFIISAIAGFTSTAVMFIISGILDILICAILCRKKLFSKMNEERAGGAVYEEVSDSTESQSDGGSLYTPV